MRFRKGLQAAVAIAVALTAVVTVSARADARGALRASLRNGSGANVGMVRLIDRSGKVMVQVDASGLAPGFHGFHVHGIGDCSAAGFTSAGGHHNPAGAAHPSHGGDMPVLFVADDGTAKATFNTDAFGVTELRDADGSAVIVHAAPDNYANIPSRYSASGPDTTTLNTGDAGARVACGVLR